jgi:hypothetical protein
VMRRIEKIPPPGSSARFCCTLEPTISTSPLREGRARSVGAAPGERDVLEEEVARAVLAQHPLLEAGLPDSVLAAVELHGARGLAYGVAG